VGDSFNGVKNIFGAVNVSNPPAYTRLNVYGGNDNKAHDVKIDAASIKGLTPGQTAITYQQSDLDSLNIFGNLGSSTYTFTNTPSNGRGVTTTLNLPGSYNYFGWDTVNVQATTGALNVNGGWNECSTVNMGNSTHGMRDIVGPVQVTPGTSGVWGGAALNLDDSVDGTFRTVTHDTWTSADTSVWGRIDGLAQAPITYKYLRNTSVSIATGRGGATVNASSVSSTPVAIPG
jgi:hypothetical protein